MPNTLFLRIILVESTEIPVSLTCKREKKKQFSYFAIVLNKNQNMTTLNFVGLPF